MTAHYGGRLGLQQRVLPAYRVPFFDGLASVCQGGLSVFAGQARRREAIVAGLPGLARHAPASNLHILGGPFYLCVQRGLTAWLEEWDPDALIVEANPRYLSTPAAVRWMKARGRPVLGWGIGAPPLSGLMRTARQARRAQFLREFDALIAYSRRGAREYEQAGFPAGRIFLAPNAVAPAPASKPERAPQGDRAEILFVGRLQRRKHVDRLLRACAEMPEPKPHLIVVGDGPERARLEFLARQVHRMTEFAGAKHGTELEPFFLRAHLFVLPGTGGLAVQEAMAHALPIIVARGDGTQDDLVRAGNGWQIAADDYPALVSTLRMALADRARLRRMGEESYRIVSEEINLDAMLGGFLKALNTLR
jgi:glycosyltransferase involved in cell wall biosynthesis